MAQVNAPLSILLKDIIEDANKQMLELKEKTKKSDKSTSDWWNNLATELGKVSGSLAKIKNDERKADEKEKEAAKREREEAEAAKRRIEESQLAIDAATVSSIASAVAVTSHIDTANKASAAAKQAQEEAAAAAAKQAQEEADAAAKQAQEEAAAAAAKQAQEEADAAAKLKLEESQLAIDAATSSSIASAVAVTSHIDTVNKTAAAKPAQEDADAAAAKQAQEDADAAAAKREQEDADAARIDELANIISISTAVAVDSFINKHNSMPKPEPLPVVPTILNSDISDAAKNVANAVAVAVNDIVSNKPEPKPEPKPDTLELEKEIERAVSLAVAIHVSNDTSPSPDIYKKETLEPIIAIAVAKALDDSVKTNVKKYAGYISAIVSALLMTLLKRRAAIMQPTTDTDIPEEISLETDTIEDIGTDTSKPEKIIDDHLHMLCKETFDKKYENLHPGQEAIYTSHDDRYCYGMLITKEERAGVYVDKSIEDVKCPFNKPYEPGANKEEYKVECDNANEEKKSLEGNIKDADTPTDIKDADTPTDINDADTPTDINDADTPTDAKIAAAIANTIKVGSKRKKSSPNMAVRKSPRFDIAAAIATSVE